MIPAVVSIRAPPNVERIRRANIPGCMIARVSASVRQCRRRRYVLDIPFSSAAATASALQAVRRSRWLDPATRCIAVSFNLQNPHTEMCATSSRSPAGASLYVSLYLYLSIYLSIYLSLYLSIHLSIYLLDR